MTNAKLTSHSSSIKRIQQRAIDSDLKMVEQTIQLLAMGGLKVVTLETVGKNAGYSRGLVTKHYGSKEGLLMRVLDFLNNWITGFLPKENALQGKVAIENSARQIAILIEQHSTYIRAYYWLWIYALESSPEAHQKLSTLNDEMFEHQKSLFQQAVELGEIDRHVDIELMANYMRTMTRGLVYSWILDPQFDIIKRAHELADLHLQLMFKNSHVYSSTNFWGE